MCQRVSCIFIRWFGHDGTRHVWSVAWCSVTHRPHCFLGSGRELPPSNVRLKCPELASLWEITSPSWWPHRWRSLEEATRGSIHYLHRYKKENPGCGCLDWIWGLSSRASRLSPQAMVHCQYHPWGVRRVGCYLGGCLSLKHCFILKTLSGGSAARSQVPAQPREMPGVGMPPYGRPCADDPTCAVTLYNCNHSDDSVADQGPEFGMIQVLCFGFSLLSFVRPAVESCGPARDQKEHWFSPNQDCA